MIKTTIRILAIGCCVLAADLLTDGLFNSGIRP